MRRPITVLIVDDSLLLREMLSSILSSDPDITVIGTAENTADAREKIKTLNPDVLTLDIEMPGMNGIDFLAKIMALRPMPVVMISTLTQKGAEATLRALELGAIDTIPKPTVNVSAELPKHAEQIITTVKIAAAAKLRMAPTPAVKTLTKPTPHTPSKRYDLIAIGASTGGVEAVRSIVERLPPSLPPIVYTQHMAPSFLESYTKRLNDHSELSITLARDGMELAPPHLYVAPAERHFTLLRSATGVYRAILREGEKISGHLPSIDVMFASVAHMAENRAFGVILTGMGADGAQGLLQMRQAGAYTVGQDEASCVVYGMPLQAKKCGAVMEEAHLHKIPEVILKHC